MSDGRLHGVHVWIGPLNMEPPERLIPGPLKWDLTAGVATDTPESIFNSGRDPSTEATHGRTFAEDLPMRALNASETKVLSMAIKGEPGMTMCSTWNVTDHQGETISVGFVARANPEITGRRQRTADLSRHELARRARGSVAAARPPGAADPRRARATRRAPRRSSTRSTGDC